MRDGADFSELYARHRFGMRLGLDRIRAVLAALGNPHGHFSSIHIAGTNGKGSAAAMLEAILREAGLRTGLYTSPHLISLNERFQIDGVPVETAKLQQALTQVMEIEAGLHLHEPLTFFEITTAASFLLFKELGVEWAVLETGMGGRLDASNVIDPKMSVITGIGLDHCQYLGDTVAKIAGEKAGIIKEGVPVICGAWDDQACAVIHETARCRHAPLVCCRIPFDGQLGLRGDFQKKNAAVAVAAIRSLPLLGGGPGRGGAITEGQIRSALARVVWPGRLQVLQEDPRVIVDGAHNPHAVRALVSYIKEEDPRPWTILLGMMADKDCDQVVTLLRGVVRRLILVKMENDRSWDPPEAVDLTAALRLARANFPPGGGILITGSLYLVGEALRLRGLTGPGGRV